MIKFPNPLVPGRTIAVTAPSSGVSGAALRRLDLVLRADVVFTERGSSITQHAS
jgi:hypothetical protein